MTTTRNFAEAIVSEYYELKGYFVETGVILPAKRSREEVDIIAIKWEADNNRFHVLQVEVGTVNQKGGVSANYKMVKKKFNPDKVESLKNHYKDRLAGKEIKYEGVYLATYIPQNAYEYIREQGENLERLGDFVNSEILPYMAKWKIERSGSTFPNNLWFMQTFEWLGNWRIDFSKYNEWK